MRYSSGSLFILIIPAFVPTQSLSPSNTKNQLPWHTETLETGKMRPAPESSATSPPAPRTPRHLVPPQPLPATTCDLPSCRWHPYSASGDFEANAAMILIVLLCGLICALALNTAIRCFLGGHGRGRPAAAHRRRPQQGQEEEEEEEEQQPEPKLGDSDLMAAPAVTYAPGVTKLAGTEAECAICLTEFDEGDGIRVLATCSHGFHVECIERWLRSHKSCPTCRSSLVVDRPGSSESEGADHCRESADRRAGSAGESLSGGAASV
ncbi:RING-H2 finger protein ATL79 [Eucalyptus grandis]|uniref:RING-H2 finger protein ATL79 n=1 Tax=Eucalyptus grandis TaxID=71139 RepID=UPI00192E98BB|nr:RING-H2 finger protein ATL79 [Eucalyptus grandis]